jgi:hypothetical protein
MMVVDGEKRGEEIATWLDRGRGRHRFSVSADETRDVRAVTRQEQLYTKMRANVPQEQSTAYRREASVMIITREAWT